MNLQDIFYTEPKLCVDRKKFAEARALYKIPMREIAEEMECSLQYISHIENGKVKLSNAKAVQLRHALGQIIARRVNESK